MISDRSAKYRRTHKKMISDRDRINSRAYEHRINMEDFYALLSLQNHSCAICSNGFKNSRDCHIDHDPVTGAVRGLLCFRCNIALGLMHRNWKNTENMLKYLKGELSISALPKTMSWLSQTTF